MKVVLLGGAETIHTIRWAKGLLDAGLEVVLASQHDLNESLALGVHFIRLPYSGEVGYFRNVRPLQRILKTLKPDILNAHYASGYGTTARLMGFKPTVLSVWGSDVYDFPLKSPLHRWWVRRNLMAATQVASTSHAMAEQTRSLAPLLDKIAITPFGVELDRFYPLREIGNTQKKSIVIGTVKKLTTKYGIDTLLEAFAILVSRLTLVAPDQAKRLILRIVGDGADRIHLIRQAEALGIAGRTEFIGRVPHEQVPDELRKLDVFVALSRLDSESFGVAVIEANACSIPVVVSNVGGLPEVVVDGVSGFVVPRENPKAAADMIERFVINADERHAMGRAGRIHVAEQYDWKKNVKQMINVYENTIKNRHVK